MEWPQSRSSRRQRGVVVRFGGWRRLALGHPIDTIVHDKIGEIDVTATGMQEMIAADGIAVAARNDDGQVGP